MSHQIAVCLGSNLGDRSALLRSALEQVGRLPATEVRRVSSTIETAPVGPEGAELGAPYLNAAAILESSLPPRELLTQLLAIERGMGRVRKPDNRYAPRTIDLDLLLYADTIVNEPGLIVPHPRMHLRRFVLEPLASIAPDWVVPTLGRTVAELLAALPPDEPANNDA